MGHSAALLPSLRAQLPSCPSASGGAPIDFSSQESAWLAPAWAVDRRAVTSAANFETGVMPYMLYTPSGLHKRSYGS
eukprot:45180-Eustigmatos_ZCMA.PRE.1